MPYDIKTTEIFAKQFKKLAKKYKSLKEDTTCLAAELAENPHIGDKIAPDTYKLRLAVKSKGKGKRGGLRIIDHVVDEKTIFTF